MIDLKDLRMNCEDIEYIKDVLDTTRLPPATLSNEEFEKLYSFKFFNTHQSYVF